MFANGALFKRIVKSNLLRSANFFVCIWFLHFIQTRTQWVWVDQVCHKINFGSYQRWRPFQQISKLPRVIVCGRLLYHSEHIFLLPLVLRSRLGNQQLSTPRKHWHCNAVISDESVWWKCEFVLIWWQEPHLMPLRPPMNNNQQAISAISIGRNNNVSISAITSNGII